MNTDAFYNRFSIFYPMADMFLKPQKKKLFDEVNSKPFGDLLEIGVGNGHHFHLYSTHTVTGIDTSQKMLEIAKRHLTPSIKLQQMDGEALLFPNDSFDYVVLSHTLAVVPDPEKLLEEVNRVLRPNGTLFILNHFTPNNGLKYLDHILQPISKLLHFKSVFYFGRSEILSRFVLKKEINFGRFSYFKLLIYDKL